MVDFQQLMRVYGALMWNLGKILGTPEVARVYIGSFWDHQLHFDTNRRLFELEQADLFQDLQSLPAYSTIRKLNDLIRRARLAKVREWVTFAFICNLWFGILCVRLHLGPLVGIVEMLIGTVFSRTLIGPCVYSF